MDLTSGIKAKVVKGTFDIIFSARRICQESRVDECLKYVDLRYQAMSVKNQLDLNVEIQSEIGLYILAKYSDAITKTYILIFRTQII
jgi:hypothetical protein